MSRYRRWITYTYPVLGLFSSSILLLFYSTWRTLKNLDITEKISFLFHFLCPADPAPLPRLKSILFLDYSKTHHPAAEMDQSCFAVSPCPWFSGSYLRIRHYYLCLYNYQWISSPPLIRLFSPPHPTQFLQDLLIGFANYAHSVYGHTAGDEAKEPGLSVSHWADEEPHGISVWFILRFFLSLCCHHLYSVWFYVEPLNGKQ